MTTPIRSNKSSRFNKGEAKDSTFAFNVEHEILAKNHLPTHNLEKGWVIDSGASAHMRPFKKDVEIYKVLIEKYFLLMDQ